MADIEAGGIAADVLRSFIERIERLTEEKKALVDDIKDIYAEAKSTGFDAKIMRMIIRRRAMDKNDREEQDALLDIYEHALMSGGGLDQAKAAHDITKPEPTPIEEVATASQTH